MSDATIRDVARAAAVSVASASRALNGHASVSVRLRERVNEAAARLRYVPHAGARNLSLARSGAIGVVLPDLHGEFYSELLRGMDAEASARGFHLLLTVMHGRAEHGVTALHAMRGRVDGLVVMAPQVDPDRLLAHLPPRTPAVLVNCAPHHGRYAELRIDNAAGAAMMIDHLVATGRRRIVHIEGPTDNIDAIERQRGVEAAAARTGLVVRLMPGAFNEADGAVAATELLSDLDAVDAIFAANDMMALGALTTLKRAGVDVPGRIAVAGFDDIPLARLISPSLTSVAFDIAGFGARAVARLAALAAGEEDRRVEAIAPMLAVRETTSRVSSDEINDRGIDT